MRYFRNFDKISSSRPLEGWWWNLHQSLIFFHQWLDSHQHHVQCFPDNKFQMLIPPANEVWEGYVFTGVCLSTGGGVCPFACWDTPLLGRHPPSRHPTGRPPTDTPGKTPPMLGYGQQAGGTHPTGMHSCWCDVLWNCDCYNFYVYLIAIQATTVGMRRVTKSMFRSSGDKSHGEVSHSKRSFISSQFCFFVI